MTFAATILREPVYKVSNETPPPWEVNPVLYIVENKDGQLPISHPVNTYIRVRMTFASCNENGIATTC